MDDKLPALFSAVEAAVAETDREYAQMPFLVRPLVRRGFAKRTGHDLDGWRALLSAARRGERTRELADALAALAEHYRGAPERAKRGMRGGSPEQVALVEQRSRARADAAVALRGALLAN